MPFRVTIQPSGHSFELKEDETLLEGALREGYGLPYGCRSGACGTCKGQVLSGEIDLGAYQPSALSDDERSAGKALFCMAHAKSDVVIEARVATSPRPGVRSAIA